MSPMSTNEHDEVQRCDWCGEHPLYVQYHDRDWGEPVHDDRLLFEFLILEGAQAGLSWLTILKKRAHYCRVYDGFEPAIVATYDDRKVAALLDDAGIVRNRLKVASSISNAQAYLAVQAEFGSFDRYIWQFVEGVPIQNRFKTMQDIPATTPLSDAISKDLKRRGFRFVGSTICYAFMQAVGMVNDHLTTCYRHAELASPRES
jgi:DNA-3-methyladenine glycosylase I